MIYCICQMNSINVIMNYFFYVFLYSFCYAHVLRFDKNANFVYVGTARVFIFYVSLFGDN